MRSSFHFDHLSGSSCWRTQNADSGETSSSQKQSDIPTGRSDRNVRSWTGLVIYGGLRRSRLERLSAAEFSLVLLDANPLQDIRMAKT